MRLSVALFLVITFICIPQSYAEKLLLLTEEWQPISFSRNGRADGLSVEIVREILYRLNLVDEIQVVPWARGWKILMEKPNVVLFTMTRTDEREKLFTMIGPVAVGTTNFFAKKGSGIMIENLEDAKKLRAIGVYRSAVEEQLLKKAGFVNLDATTLPLSSAKKLMLNRIDLWCNANLTAGKILEEAGYSINNVENVFTLQENHLYIAFSRGTAEAVVDMWQSTLEAIKNDGTFARIYHKWLPIDTPPLTTERLGILK